MKRMNWMRERKLNSTHFFYQGKMVEKRLKWMEGHWTQMPKKRAGKGFHFTPLPTASISVHQFGGNLREFGS
jgi:hypothetical protein